MSEENKPLGFEKMDADEVEQVAGGVGADEQFKAKLATVKVIFFERGKQLRLVDRILKKAWSFIENRDFEKAKSLICESLGEGYRASIIEMIDQIASMY